ncbi:MAG: TrmH family RNA methyltransferase [Bdellovibrionaceae bacterium]|nr:TrmH family RNA methyltransferase [Bdellovibrio sp.]
MKLLEITSASNAQYKIWQSLLTSKGIKSHLQFFLMGAKLVEEFLLAPDPQFSLEYILFDQEIPFTTVAKKTILTKELFKTLDVLGTHAPLLVLSFKNFSEKDLLLKPKGLELICPLGDPRNLGALIRSAVGFGVSEIILTQESTHPFLPHAIKASAGAALKINFSVSPKKLAELPMVGDNYALELHGTKLSEVSWPNDLRLWVGEEGPGLGLTLDQKRIMKFINIPTEGIESLNATISTALALWEWRKSSC